MGKSTFAKESPDTMKGNSSSSSNVPLPSELSDAKVGSAKGETEEDGKIHIHQVDVCDDGSVYGEGYSGETEVLHLCTSSSKNVF